MGNAPSSVGSPPNDLARSTGDELVRPSKRKRTSTRDGDGCDNVVMGASSDGESAASSSLPPEVWASVMNYLDYQSVLSCGAASKMILHDALPLVTSLHIDKSSQLNGLASRFRDVREINICSLLVRAREDSLPDEEGNVDMEVDLDTVMMAPLFISRLDKLERLFLGGRDSGTGEMFGFGEYHHTYGDQDEKRVQRLIIQISVSYRRNFLPRNLLVLGLRCPPDGSGLCPCCELACQTWPIEHVINFHSAGSSKSVKMPFLSKRPDCLDVCLTRGQIEDIVESRPGGADLLHSESRLLYLLGQGCRFTIHSDDNSPLYIVDFFQDQIEEMKRTIEASQLDVNMLTREDVFNAMKKSFASDVDPKWIPPKSQCYLDHLPVELTDDLGIPIFGEDWVDYGEAKKHHLPHIIQVLNNDVGSDSPVHWICMFWLANALKHSKDLLSHQVIDFGALPLLDYLNSEDAWMVQETTHALAEIARYGSATHTNALVEMGVYPRLVQLLTHSSAEVQKYALRAVKHHIFTDGLFSAPLTSEIGIQCRTLRDETFIEPLLNSEVISRLLSFMSSPKSGIQYDACQIIICGMTMGRNPHIHAIVSQGCVRSFCGLLTSNSVKRVKLGLAALVKVLLFGRECGRNAVCKEVKDAVRGEIQSIDAKLAELENNDVSDISRMNQSLIHVLREEVDRWNVLLLQEES